MSCIFIAVRAFSSCSALLFTAVLSLLTALVSLVSEHRLRSFSTEISCSVAGKIFLD